MPYTYGISSKQNAVLAQDPLKLIYDYTENDDYTTVTFNPNDKNANITLVGGDLTAVAAATSWKSARATLGYSSGKHYFEYTPMTGVTTWIGGVGKATASTATYPGGDTNGYGFGNGANKYYNGAAVGYGATQTTGDVIGVALDLDGGTLSFYKNGIPLGVAYSNLSGTFFPMVSPYTNGYTIKINFGAMQFPYGIPTGFLPWQPSLGILIGLSKFNETPVSRKIRFHLKSTGFVIGDTTSDATTGEQSFPSYWSDVYAVMPDDTNSGCWFVA